MAVFQPFFVSTGRILTLSGLLGLLLLARSTASAQKPGKNEADIIFQSMCSKGGTKGILDANFPVKISWRCSKCGKAQEVTVQLEKSDNSDSAARKIANAVNKKARPSGNVTVTYYQSSKTEKQDQNWYRIHFTGVDKVDAGGWHSKMKFNILAGPGVSVPSPSAKLPPNVTPGKPGRTLKPGKVIKRKYHGIWAGSGFGWKKLNWNISVRPWSGNNEIGGFLPWHPYHVPASHNRPREELLDEMEILLAADGFEVLRLDGESLAITGGPDNTVVNDIFLEVCPEENGVNGEQEEHWEVGDVVSNTDEEPVVISPDVEMWMEENVELNLNDHLSALATDVALQAGLQPWPEYPPLLAQEPCFEDLWVAPEVDQCPPLPVDTVPPVVFCPQDLVLPYQSDTQPQGEGGQATAEDNSGMAEVFYMDSVRPAPPQGEIIERTWVALDERLNTSRCVQSILVESGGMMASFRRGDVDTNGELNITDTIQLLNFQFVGTVDTLDCMDAADLDDNGDLNVADAIRGLNFQFTGSAPPPEPPGPYACGPDVEDDGFPPCAYPEGSCQ